MGMSGSGPGGSRRWTALVGAWTLLAAVACALLSGFFLHPHAFGAHDWDQMESHRYFVVKSIRDFGQMPAWDPYGCGGFPAWGSPEAATNVVSPFLPAYLALPLGVALRIEVTALVVLLVVGAWVFARRYVNHPLALAFACLFGALNSRMALQAAVGHSWHLYYAGLPWVLAAFDRACGPEQLGPAPVAREVRLRWVAAGAGVLAWMVYGGGIYPVPHTALCLVGIALYRARAQRDTRPLRVAGVMGGWAALLAAPKLLAVAATMSRFPRTTRSFETVDPLSWLRMFVSSAASIPGNRIQGLDYLFHEYGQYVGLAPLAILVWANAGRLPRDPALRSLRFVGWALMALALGAWGPWLLLHLVPPFRSQHVPTRFTYPAFLLLSVVAAAVLERLARDLRSRLTAGRWRALAAGGWVAFTASAALVAREDAACTAPWFALQVPSVPERTDGYRQYAQVPPELFYGDGNPQSPGGVNGGPGLLMRRANVGALFCFGLGSVSEEAAKRPETGHHGALGVGDADYRGEFWVEPAGNVQLVRWSPSEVALSVDGAQPGSVLVLNQNWDPGWTANGVPSVAREDRNAFVLTSPAQKVTFRYRSPGLVAGLVLCALGLLLGPALALLRRLAEERAAAEEDAAEDDVVEL